MRALGAALSLGVLALLGGCERRELTGADCARIKGRLEAAWERDALAAQRESTNDVFIKFVRDEKSRIGADWMRKCTPMVGRAVSDEELTCLDRADTIDDVYECGL